MPWAGRATSSNRALSSLSASVVSGPAIESIGRDQIEAARSFGLTKWQVLRHIIAPQAMAFAIGPLTGLLVNQLQVTSLISVIGVMDLTKIRATGFEPAPVVDQLSAYLRTLPITRLKIDGSFVRDILVNKRSEAAVRGIAQLARSFNEAVHRVPRGHP